MPLDNTNETKNKSSFGGMFNERKAEIEAKRKIKQEEDERKIKILDKENKKLENIKLINKLIEQNAERSKVEFPDIQKIKGNVNIENFPKIDFDLKPVIETLKTLKPIEKQEKDYTGIFSLMYKQTSAKLAELKTIVDLLKKLPSLTKIENLIASLIPKKPFEFDREGRLKVNIDKVSSGGGGGGSEHVKNSSGEYIDPATKQKQDEMIAAINAILGSTPYNYIQSDTGATYKYYGFASSTGWQFKRKTLATGVWQVASGEGDYDTNWADRATKSYGNT